VVEGVLAIRAGAHLAVSRPLPAGDRGASRGAGPGPGRPRRGRPGRGAPPCLRPRPDSTCTAAPSRWPIGLPPPTSTTCSAGLACSWSWRGERPREPRCDRPVRRRVRRGRAAPRPHVRRPALPPERARLDGARSSTSPRPAEPLAGRARQVRAAGFEVVALTPAPDAGEHRLARSGSLRPARPCSSAPEGPGLSAAALAAPTDGPASRCAAGSIP